MAYEGEGGIPDIRARLAAAEMALEALPEPLTANSAGDGIKIVANEIRSDIEGLTLAD